MTKFVFNASCYAVCVRMLSFVIEALKGLDGAVRVDLAGLNGRLAERVLREVTQLPHPSKTQDAENLAEFREYICDKTQSLDVMLRSPMRPVDEAFAPLQVPHSFGPALTPYGNGEGALASATRMAAFNVQRARDALGALLILAELAAPLQGCCDLELSAKIDRARDVLTLDEQHFEFRQLKLALVAGSHAELTALRARLVESEFCDDNCVSHYFTIGGRLPAVASSAVESSFRSEVRHAAVQPLMLGASHA